MGKVFKAEKINAKVASFGSIQKGHSRVDELLEELKRNNLFKFITKKLRNK